MRHGPLQIVLPLRVRLTFLSISKSAYELEVLRKFYYNLVFLFKFEGQLYFYWSVGFYFRSYWLMRKIMQVALRKFYSILVLFFIFYFNFLILIFYKFWKSIVFLFEFYFRSYWLNRLFEFVFNFLESMLFL